MGLTPSCRPLSTHTQLHPWLEAFPPEQLLVLFMDDMKTPEAAHAQVAKARPVK